MKAASRFRVERCEAHGIAVGLCTVGTCKGASEARKKGRQLVAKLKPMRCVNCHQSRGDAVPRGKFHGVTPTHPGYQSHICDDCWGNREAREEEAARLAAHAQLMAGYRANQAATQESAHQDD